VYYQSKITVYGKVQGVGYRASVYDYIKNNSLNIFGNVKNQLDGTVLVIAQANESNLDLLYSFLKKGPTFSKVQKIEYQAEKIENLTYKDFNVIY
jgi:acylphosphatase